MKRILVFILSLLLALGVLLPAAAAENGEVLPPAVLSENEKKAVLSALYEADIATVRRAVELRLISCVELTAYYLERIEAYNTPYNCFITMCDNALAEAQKRDELITAGTAQGALFGVPVVVKDNIDYEGYHTTNGNKKTSEQIAKSNAAVVQRLLDEGAVILAKSNMSTEAQSAYYTKSKAAGETYNAYNRELAAGGSSGGSAVATTLNFAMAGLGTDTNSSLRYPASLGGLVSMRPTSGLIARDGLVLLNKTRDTAGAITRTVRDQAIMLDVLVGGGKYAESLDPNALSGMRIGILKELSGVTKSTSGRTESTVDAEILAAFSAAADELRALGAEVIEVSMPKVFSLSSACKESKSGYAAAKDKFYAEYEKLLSDNNISAVIYPTYLHAPQYTGVDGDGAIKVYKQTYINNCSVISPPLGLPEICVPIGIHSRGASIGMQISSLRNSEQLLLDIAYSYTEKYDHRTVPTGAPDAYAEYHTGSLAEIIAAYEESQKPDTTPETTVPETTRGEVTMPPVDETRPPETTAPTTTAAEGDSLTAEDALPWVITVFTTLIAAMIFYIIFLRARKNAERF